MIAVDIGVLLPTGSAQWGPDGDPRDLVAFGVHAERSVFSSLFVNDSLISPRIEALTMLAALAPATDNVTLGTGALLPFLRRPIQAAQAIASVDLLSGGRLVVAVGAGFPAASDGLSTRCRRPRAGSERSAPRSRGGAGA
jgi:alkanesulfonate monooxygenase SsuD/methylene tetrahydromethanopterin reductase-like flavin-dependent oxidoreductase (luciferase family)